MPTDYPLGLHLPAPGHDGPAQAAVFAQHASSVEVLLLDPTGRRIRSRHPLGDRLDGVWRGDVADVAEGDLYALRVDGPWQPDRGLRHNPDKLLIDPYARLITGRIGWGQSTFGHQVDAEWRPVDGEVRHGGASRRDSTPNLGQVPLAVASRPPVANQELRPRTPWNRTVAYEMHLRGYTMRHPEVPHDLRGTWAGLGHPAVVDYLASLGITAVELLPVFAIGDETHLVRRGMTNYWGYNTLGFFAPDLRYVSRPAQAGGPAAVLAEVHGTVEVLHRAGIEVWLDVVYNHTCEGGVDGPTLSFRGIDAASYYRLDHTGRDVDVTGCGNTLNFAHARVIQLALDSLRYWVTTFGIDGYRFDLAPALARRAPQHGDAFDPDHPFLVAARCDPVLQDVKLVAEPWDLGTHGWRTGHFPPPFAEWNDHYRDSVRTYWLSDAAAARNGGGISDVRDLATRLAGSSDLFATSASFDRVERDTHASINFVTAHDGFTLADLTAYDHKHNYANGEGNRDGSPHNRSWNHGAEGDTDDEWILSARKATIRGVLATLLVSTGTPMLLAGDELGRSQRGNNNAYCLDDPQIWVDWEGADDDLIASTRALLEIRERYPVLRQSERFARRPAHPDGTSDLGWFGPRGRPMDHASWHNSAVRTLQVFLHGDVVCSESVLIVLHSGLEPIYVTLPGPPWAHGYELLWDSSLPRPRHHGGEYHQAGRAHEYPARCVRIYVAHR